MSKIFIFGSNLAGRHGKGAAKFAMQAYGAIYGQGYGLQGNSFAIPTKDANLKTLPLKFIEGYVKKFCQFSRDRTDLGFILTLIGCGLAGYEPKQIAPMFFKELLDNVDIPKEFLDVADRSQYQYDWFNEVKV